MTVSATPTSTQPTGPTGAIPDATWDTPPGFPGDFPPDFPQDFPGDFPPESTLDAPPDPASDLPPDVVGPCHVREAPAEFTPEDRGTEYVYIRLANHLATRIRSGEYGRGTRLPAERDLAREYGVSVGTVRRMATQLRQRGLLLTLPAKGNYVP